MKKNGGSGGGVAAADYVAKVHVDYSIDQGRQLVQDLIGMDEDDEGKDEDDEGLFTYLILNVWRNIATEPVSQNPMTVADCSTFNKNHIYNVHLMLKPDCPALWYYYPKMEKSDILVFKQYDSTTGSDLSDITFHTSFQGVVDSSSSSSSSSTNNTAAPTDDDNNNNPLPMRQYIETRIALRLKKKASNLNVKNIKQTYI